MLMDNTDVLLHTVSTFVDGDSFDLPTTCSCGGKIQHRGPHLLICHRCRKLMTKIDLLSGVVNKIAEQFILRYPQTPANEIHGNLTAAIVAHERSMAEVNARHQQLLAGRDLAPQLPHGVLIESAKAHGLGLSPDHGIEIPIIYSGRLVATDTVKEGGEIIWGDPSGVQALVGDQVNEVVVAPRGAVPIILHDVVNISALGLYPQATESVLPGKLFAPFKTVIFTPMFDDERLLSIACSVLKMKADARLITTNAEACNWSSNRAVRSAIKNSVDLVLHMIDNLSEVGDYGHEQMRHELEQLIVATPAGARRNRYMARLAKATGRRKRDVESDLEGVSRSVADASAADIIEDPIKAVVWPTNQTRPPRAGQDAVNATLFYTVRVKVVEVGYQPALVTSGRDLLLFTSEHLKPLGLEMPDELPDVMPGRWSQQPNELNSLCQFLKGKAETSMTKLVDDLAEELRRRLWFRDGLVYPLLACTVVATYCSALTSTCPYLFLYGLRETGKTLLLEILERLCFNAKLGLPNKASLYRLVDQYAATLLIDEVRKGIHNDVMAVLKTGYRREGSVLLIAKGRPKSFSTYGVKVFAGTRGYDDELLDRGILLICERRRDHNANFNAVEFDKQVASSFRNRLHSITLSSAERIAELLADSGIAGPLRGREREIFRLPAAVARLADGEDGGKRWSELMEFAMGNAISKMAVVDAGDVDVPALVEAVAKCCKSEPCVPHHSHTYVAKGFTKKIAQEMDRRRLDPRKLGAELVRVGLLGSSKEDRPKLYLRSEGKSNACWRIDPVRVKDVADRFGVRIDSLDRDDGENQCG
jgi:hypothetical protein